MNTLPGCWKAQVVAGAPPDKRPAKFAPVGSQLDGQEERAHIPVILKEFKIIVEKHTDGFVAYPLGIRGACVAEGNTYEEALAAVKSALQFHWETFEQN